MIHIMFCPEKPIHNVKLCKNCAHFQPAQKTCALYGRMNVIDGAIEFAAASTVRDKFCKERYFTELLPQKAPATTSSPTQ